MLKDRIPKKYRWVFPTLVVCALFVIYFTGIWAAVGKFISYFVPLIVGACVAFIMNLPMKALDKILFPHAVKPLALKAKKVFLVTITFLMILTFIILLFYLVVPSLKNTLKVFTNYLPSVFDQFKAWTETKRELFPDLVNAISEFRLDVNEIVNFVTGFITSDSDSMLSSTFSVISSTASAIYNTLMAAIFALYVLYNKKILGRQFHRILHAYTPASIYTKVDVTLKTANKCFSSFISGQCIQACILGTLCVLLMMVLGFPEPVMIGVFVGATSIIPLLGSYLGSIVGILIVTAIEPSLALWYALFIFILQQFVASVIYPKVVGRSTGLPGMWVLAGVLVGGAMAGITGMIIGVPVTATLYQLLRADVERRERQPDTPDSTEEDMIETEQPASEAEMFRMPSAEENASAAEVPQKTVISRNHTQASANSRHNKKKH